MQLQQDYSPSMEFNIVSEIKRLFYVRNNFWNFFKFFKMIFSDAASGNAQDHAYGHFNIPLSFTFEMRGNGAYGHFGFFLPPEFIIPNAEEILESYIGLVQKAREFGRLN